MHNTSLFQEYVYLSRYSRFLHEKNRRESWDETVNRYFDFFTVHLKEKCGYLLDEELKKELYKAVYNFEVMPSMRCIMTAGQALQKENIAGYNPVSGDTLVVTKEYGNVQISSLVGKKCHVLNKNGKWAIAQFKTYGKQKTHKIKFRLNSNTIKEVNATSNHRWYLSDGQITSTENLKIKDKINFISAEKPEIDDDYKLGVIHGLIYGDGTATYAQKRVKGYHIRICSDIEDILPWFEGYPICYPTSANGDPVIMLYDGFAKTHSLKELPSEQETDSYLLGFMRGWFAADGYVSKSSQISVCMNNEGKDWIFNNSERIGFVPIRAYKLPRVTNFGERKHDTYSVFFSRSSFCMDDFLISRKKERFKPLQSYFSVESIVEDTETEVFCAEVKDTNTFTLAGGLITGNCSYIPIDSPKAFSEVLYILMNGTGVGFSVERQYINKLPEIPDSLYPTETTIVVGDSKLGWAKALNELISLLYTGLIPNLDVSKLRPAGAILKTFGGRSSGSKSLVNLFEFIINTFKNAVGRKLTSIECHDITCMIGECVVVGGVRRSALISLSNLSDDRMRAAKNGQWWALTPYRSLANNSAVYNDKRPNMDTFMTEWKSLYDSKSGERGIFSRYAAKNVITRSNTFRTSVFGDDVRTREIDWEFGCNPCSEILLRPDEFCNLSEIVVRSNDTIDTLKRKARLASILGTFQSTLTNFRFISKKWKDNTENERLLGVSMTGIMDNLITNGGMGADALKEVLTECKKVVIKTNLDLSKKLGIESSVACTAVKPSGTVSALVDSASGIHARHSPYYLRAVRSDKKDPIGQLMIDQGFYYEDDKMRPDHNWVFYFPSKSPDHAVCRKNIGAIQQLELWMVYQLYWAEHKPSITVSVKEEEWFDVGAWVYKNFEFMSGISFLPFSDHIYQQAPFQDISEDEYKNWQSKMPNKVDWSVLTKYEKSDTTTGSQELACSASKDEAGEMSVGCAL